MKNKFYTLKEIAEILNVGESTVRYWRDQYSEFLPYTGEGRKKRYPENAVNMLRFTAECVKRGMNSDEIKKALMLEFQSVDCQVPEENPHSDSPAAQLSVLHEIDDKFTEKLDRMYEIAERSVLLLERIAVAVEKLAEHIHTEPPKHINEPKKEIQPEPDNKPDSQSNAEDTAERDKVIQRVEKLLEQGISYQKVAELLNQEGVATFSGKGKWHGKTISRMLKQK